MTAINSNRAIRGPVTAVPVVAGTGVRFVEDVPNNRVVAEVDETVLWTGSKANGTISLSETVAHFQYIRVFYLGGSTEFVSTDTEFSIFRMGANDAGGLRHTFWARWLVNGANLTFNTALHSWNTYGTNNSEGTNSGPDVWRVVGINRIASN